MNMFKHNDCLKIKYFAYQSYVANGICVYYTCFNFHGVKKKIFSSSKNEGVITNF